MPANTTILIPLYNDAESLNTLLAELGQALGKLSDHRFSVLIVDDGSSEAIHVQNAALFPTEILRLQRNIGHQKAIAIGLAWLKENKACDNVLVMDSDGEDRPEDAVALLNALPDNPGKIIFAQRKSRQEGNRFRLFYKLYKLFFRVLTGQRIAFGNFMVMPKPVLDKAVFYSEIWSHIAGGLLKAGLPYTAIETHRGKRYAGKSKMNFTSLLLHGLGAIAVFMEVIATRLLIFSLLLIGLSLTAILVLVGIKTFSDYAIPGWTSTVVSAMLIVLLQSFLLSLFTIFLYLSSQSQRKFIPAHHYKDYTGAIETIN
jgi:glycosyltransferase involved in cell wall biosynthesis